MVMLVSKWKNGAPTATTRRVATIQDISGSTRVCFLVLARKLHHVACLVRPGRCFVRRSLHLNRLHLNGDERAGQGRGVEQAYEEGRCTEGIAGDCEMVDGNASRGGEDSTTYLPFGEATAE